MLVFVFSFYNIYKGNAIYTYMRTGMYTYTLQEQRLHSRQIVGTFSTL